MTEGEWERCADPGKMLKGLRRRRHDRQLRLFACAACRHLLALLPERNFGLPPWPESARAALAVAERFADGLAGRAELRAAYAAAAAEYDRHRWLEYAFTMAAYASAWKAADHIVMALRYYLADELPALLACTADEFPRRDESGEPAGADYSWAEGYKGQLAALLRDVVGNPHRPVAADPSWLAWSDGAIPKLARAVYDERAFDRLPVLADALEEAGCSDADLLGHLRGPGPHVRGCFAIDALLGRS